MGAKEMAAAPGFCVPLYAEITKDTVPLPSFPAEFAPGTVSAASAQTGGRSNTRRAKVFPLRIEQTAESKSVERAETLSFAWSI